MGIAELLVVFAFVALPVAMYGAILGTGIYLVWNFIAIFAKIEVTSRQFVSIWLVSSVIVFFYFFGSHI